MTPRKDEPESSTKSSGDTDQPKAARTYSGARGNRPGDYPPAARFRKASPEDLKRKPGSYPELDAELERMAEEKEKREKQEKEELEAAIKKANG